MQKTHSKISEELRGNFMKEDFPIPFGILDNQIVSDLPYSHKRLIADAFYRAWAHKLHKRDNGKLFFVVGERGPYYKKFHYFLFLEKVFLKFEKLGFVKRKSKEVFTLEMEKILGRC